MNLLSWYILFFFKHNCLRLSQYLNIFWNNKRSNWPSFDSVVVFKIKTKFLGSPLNPSGPLCQLSKMIQGPISRFRSCIRSPQNCRFIQLQVQSQSRVAILDKRIRLDRSRTRKYREHFGSFKEQHVVVYETHMLLWEINGNWRRRRCSQRDR